MKVKVPTKGKHTGKKKKSWTIGKRLPISPGASQQFYECKCECGTQKPVSIQNILRGGSKSCGCRPFKVVRTKKFRPRKVGNFSILSISHYHRATMPVYNIKCDCGNYRQILACNIKLQVGCSRFCPLSPLNKKKKKP